MTTESIGYELLNGSYLLEKNKFRIPTLTFLIRNCLRTSTSHANYTVISFSEFSVIN